MNLSSLGPNHQPISNQVRIDQNYQQNRREINVFSPIWTQAIFKFIYALTCISRKWFETYELHGPRRSRLFRPSLRGCLDECANTMKIKNITFRESLVICWHHVENRKLIQLKWIKTGSFHILKNLESKAKAENVIRIKTQRHIFQISFAFKFEFLILYDSSKAES